jgi:hemolysin III
VTPVETKVPAKELANKAAVPAYSRREEIANSLTHGVGIVLSIAGLAVLSAFAALYGDARHISAAAIFGAALILCYTTSTLYHAIPIERIRQTLRALDHSAIFVLIAGTYTPFMLISIGGTLGWTMLVLIWMLAVGGIVARLALKGRRHGFVVAFYVAMGWLAIFTIKPLVAALGHEGLMLLLGGGVAYSVGVIFYVWRRLPYSHAIWHGFVLTGSALHFFAVLLYVLPGAPATVT